MHHETPQKVHFDTAFSLGLLRGILVAGAVAALGPVVAWIYGDPRLGSLLIAVGLSSLITGFWNPKLVVFQRELSFLQEFLLSSADKIAGFVVGVAVAVIWQTYWALVIGIAVGQLTAVIVGYVLIPYRPHLTISRWRELLSFSAWLGLGQAVGALSWRLDQLVVGYLLGPVQAGFISVGDRLATLPTREATGPIARTAFPALARIRDDSDRLRQAYTRVQGVLFAIALPAGVGTALVADPVVKLVLGEQWIGTILIIQVAAANLAFQSLSSVVGPLHMAIGQTKKMFYRQLLVLGIRTPLVLGGLLLAGVPGLLVGRCLNGAIIIVINAAMVRSAIGIGIRQQFLANQRSILAVALMSIAVIAVGYVTTGDDSSADLAWQLAIKFATALASDIAVLFGFWQLCGHPDGPEREIATLLARGRRKYAGRKT